LSRHGQQSNCHDRYHGDSHRRSPSRWRRSRAATAAWCDRAKK
jgi:hypothetical protein